MGYSFDWQNFTFAKNGGFYFKSAPASASIFINGESFKTTPRLISRLTPQTYDISITKDGFYPWQKKLTVMPELVTEARNILLFPKNFQPELVATSSTSTIGYFLSSNEDRQKQLQAQKIASTTATWILNGDNILYINKTDKLLYQTDLSGFIKNQISKKPLPDGQYKIIAGSDRYFAVLIGTNLYWLNQENNFEIIASQVKDAVISSDNKKILYWNEHEVSLFYLEKIQIQPYKEAYDKELIFANSKQKISQVIFYPNNEYIALVIDDQIKVIELDGRDKHNAINFISAKNPQIYFDQPNSSFYYLTEGNLWRVKIEF
jgi:hypothetical protein